MTDRHLLHRIAMRLALIALAAITTVGHPARAEDPGCGGATEPCVLPDGRSYHLRLPDGWDGTSPLPVLMHFHGWARQGPLIIRHRRIAGATAPRGVLLVAPNGRGRSWNFWTPDTEDVPFADAVLADVRRRLPLREDRIMVSGYSYGSAMAWRYACARGRRLFALLAVAGSFPDQNESCQPVARVAHVHGTRDTVMDFPFGADGDVTGPVRLWRRENDCTGGPARSNWQAFAILPFERHVWTCADDRQVTLDVHARGHFIPRGWIAHWLDRLL